MRSSVDRFVVNLQDNPLRSRRRHPALTADANQRGSAFWPALLLFAAGGAVAGYLLQTLY